MDHELRYILNDELHSRAGLRLVAPAHVTHLVFTDFEDDEAPLRHMATLVERLGRVAPEPSAFHISLQLDAGLLRYERHGEFYRLAMVAEAPAGPGVTALSLVPADWLAAMPGKRLVAIHTRVLAASDSAPTDAELVELFGHDDLAASAVSQGKATVWADFRIGADGFSRMLVHDQGLTPLRLGRVVRRLHEIETYRMMALLALPLARDIQPRLRGLEINLHDLISRITAAHNTENDSDLLASLSHISRDVEELSNRVDYRFSATRAYGALVEKRVAELGEVRIRNFQRIGIFMDRRFTPALATCAAASQRIAGLAHRAERAGNLLRTRVDIALEAQNQSLLRSMDQRARQQLQLQQTVEGLSVVAISYYLVGLLSKLTESLAGYWAPLASKWLTASMVPLVFLCVWLALRQIKSRFKPH